MKLAKTKERIRAKAEANEQQRQLNNLAQMIQPNNDKKMMTDDELIDMFNQATTTLDQETEKKPKKSKKSKAGKKKKTCGIICISFIYCFYSKCTLRRNHACIENFPYIVAVS